MEILGTLPRSYNSQVSESPPYLHSVRTIPQLAFLMLACFLIVTSIFQMYIDVAIINKVQILEKRILILRIQKIPSV